MFHLIEPELGRISGGLEYNRQIIDAADGAIRRHQIAGSWPNPTAGQLSTLTQLVERLDGPILLDGLIGCQLPTPLQTALPVVLLVHALAETPKAHAREARNLRAAAAVVVTSHHAAAQVRTRYAVDATVAQPGVTARAQAAGNHGKHLLCVGAIEPNKNQAFLVRVMQRLVQRGLDDWHLSLVGPVTDPEYAQRLEQQIQRLSAGTVTLTGALDNAQLAEAYGRTDLLLLASHRETFGMVVAEAAAAGIPALVAAGTGAVEALVTGRALELDEHSWTQALARWLTDATCRNTMTAEARTARTQLATGWENTAAVILDVLAST